MNVATRTTINASKANQSIKLLLCVHELRNYKMRPKAHFPTDLGNVL